MSAPFAQHQPVGHPCAGLGCNKRTPATPYKIKDQPEEYCSQACRDVVYYNDKKGGKKMRVASSVMPGSGLTREVCDHCGGSIPLIFHGRGADRGHYCSTKCRAAEEAKFQKENTNMVTADAAVAVPNEEKHVKKATKKATKKGKAKAAKKTKAAKGEIKPGSVQEKVLKLMQRKEGASAKEIMKATGWSGVWIRAISDKVKVTVKNRKDGTPAYFA